MRYSRMKEEAAQETQKSGRTGAVLLILILAAAVVYVIAAGKTGSFLSDKVIKPVMGYFNEGKETDDISDDVKTQEVETITEEIVFPAAEMYLLQVGVFGEESNAEKAAAEIAGMGGAGFVRTDGDSYRVIISGYGTKNDAENVKDRLLSEQNMQTKLLEVIADESAFTVTARREEIELFREISKESSALQSQLMQHSVDLDKGSITVMQLTEKIDPIRETVKKRKETLSSIAEGTEDDLIEKALEYYTNISAELERINENMSNVALSSAVKHSYISAAYAYLDFTAES